MQDRTEYLLLQPRSIEVADEILRLNYGLLDKQLNRFGLRNNHDAISFGYEAMYNAVMTYNGKSKFSTYATVCIYNRLGSYIRTLKTTEPVLSYDAPIGNDGDTFLDLLSSSETADKNIIMEEGIESIHSCITYCYNEIKNPLHKSIVDTWVGSEFKMSQASIAELNGCTQTYVSVVLGKFKSKLKKKLEEFEYEEYC